MSRGGDQVRHKNLAIGLFLASSVISILVWFASTPELALQPSFAPTPSREAAIDDSTFIKRMKAALNEDVSEPPVEDRARLMKASYVVGYGVTEEYLRRICHETTKR